VDTSSSISVPGTTPTSTIAEASEHIDKQSSYQQNKILPVQSKQRLAPGFYYKKKRNRQDAGTSESSSSAPKKIVRLYFLAICNHVFQLTTFVLHQKKKHSLLQCLCQTYTCYDLPILREAKPTKGVSAKQGTLLPI